MPRAAKRTKLSEHTRQTIEEPPLPKPDKHDVFTAWAQHRGVEITSVKPARLPGRGLGLVATTAISKGTRLLFVPEKAIFKPDPKLLKRQRLGHVSPQAQLAVSALTACKAEASPQAVWEATWPANEDFVQSLPLCWTQEQRKLLPQPIHQPLERQQSDYDRDWSAVAAYCHANGWTEHDFRYYWMIVDSRSFHWKPPGAKPGTMVMCPFIDYMNHGPTGSTCSVSQSPDGYEVLASQHYKAGEEVLATYGAHSNDKLLVHYGFICASQPNGPSPDDDIRLDHLILPQLSGSVKGQLQDVGFLGVYGLLPAHNELCFKTQVAVRAALFTSNEWEYFMLEGVDLSQDRSKEVDEFVKPLLQAYHTECITNIELLANKGEEQPIRLLLLRWKQIEEALEAYLTR